MLGEGAQNLLSILTSQEDKSSDSNHSEACEYIYRISYSQRKTRTCCICITIFHGLQVQKTRQELQKLALDDLRQLQIKKNWELAAPIYSLGVAIKLEELSNSKLLLRNQFRFICVSPISRMQRIQQKGKGVRARMRYGFRRKRMGGEDSSIPKPAKHPA